MPEAGTRNRIADEHAQLSALLDEVVLIDAPVRLVPKLEKLHTLLREHFHHEEGKEGLQAALGRSASHLLPTLQHLYDDHQVFLRDLEGLIGRARKLAEGQVRTLMSGVAKLAERLEAHEAEENELFTDAVYTELGGGD
ncbi:MAG: hypothetical protein KDD47_14705 [Acidobacteria bacterium]|nr:hypothetical protein [Acidobacteriota bacterium]